MASNPYVNKVVYGNSTLIDLSQDTATQADVAQGKYFHLPTGERVQGTASGGGGTGGITQDQDGYLVLSPDGGGGGGGGLEYEEGTWTPSADIANPFIQFSETHATLPVAIVVGDTANDVPNSSIFGVALGAWYNLCGQSFGNYLGGGVRRVVSSSGSASYSNMSIYSQFNDYITPTGFYPSGGQTSYYFRAGRTYKWIAVWPPTT